jgi:hypothetical protein
VAQFGKGDKYFGIATLLVTMPGLPMFGHGQIEGFEEKYGMEYRRSYKDEKPDGFFIDRHEREIFPLMKKRHLFSGSADFNLYDLFTPDGSVNENVFAYSNRSGDDRALILYNNAYTQTSGWIHPGAVAIPQKDGRFRQDNLSQALSLHGEDGYFVLFREQRSNRWYIRSTKEVTERGLFVVLNGYEAQVFLDIREIRDEQGRWAQFCGVLNGRGVPDPDAAFMDFFLEELYTAFAAIFAPDVLEKLYAVFTGASGSKGKSAKPGAAKKALIDALREPIGTFIATAIKYLDGGGRYEPFTTERDYVPVTPEAIVKDLNTYFDRLASFAEPAPTARLLKPFGAQIAERPVIAAFAAGYGILAALRSVIGAGAHGADAAALTTHWQLDRKLQEQYRELGVSGGEAYRVTGLMKAVLSRTAPETAPSWLSAAGIDAGALVLEHYNAEDFRAALGINLFEDVVWFNKEAFDAALFYAPLFLLAETDSAFTAAKPNAADWPGRAERIAAIVEQCGKAGAASGYRLDRLIEGLSKKSAGAKPKKAKTGKPGAQ